MKIRRKYLFPLIVILCIAIISICTFCGLSVSGEATDKNAKLRLKREQTIRELGNQSQEVFSNYSMLAEEDDAEAQYYLGLCYLYGVGTAVDKTQTINMIRKSAEQGFVPAQSLWGDWNLTGYMVGDENAAEAVKYLYKAATQGDPWAQFRFGQFYLDGWCVEVDGEKAVRCFRLSAKQGMPSAMHELSFCYRTGRGVEADENEAEKWYCRAHRLSPTMERIKKWAKEVRESFLFISSCFLYKPEFFDKTSLTLLTVGLLFFLIIMGYRISAKFFLKQCR